MAPLNVTASVECVTACFKRNLSGEEMIWRQFFITCIRFAGEKQFMPWDIKIGFSVQIKSTRRLI